MRAYMCRQMETLGGSVISAANTINLEGIDKCLLYYEK